MAALIAPEPAQVRGSAQLEQPGELRSSDGERLRELLVYGLLGRAFGTEQDRQQAAEIGFPVTFAILPGQLQRVVEETTSEFEATVLQACRDRPRQKSRALQVAAVGVAHQLDR